VCLGFMKIYIKECEEKGERLFVLMHKNWLLWRRMVNVIVRGWKHIYAMFCLDIVMIHRIKHSCCDVLIFLFFDPYWRNIGNETLSILAGKLGNLLEIM